MDCETLRNISLHKNYGDSVAHLTVVEQQLILKLKELECICKMKSTPVTLTGPYCQRIWDRVMCWDDAEPGSVVYKTCPGYINNFKTDNLASRICMENGTWFTPPNRNSSNHKGWTNYTRCLDNGTSSVLSTSTDVPNIFAIHFDSIRMMCDVGYGISFLSLILACVIMIYFRRLHCSRNYIHLNLFLSFILRAATSLIRDSFMVGGLGFPDDVSYNTSGQIIFKEGKHWECRMFFSVFYYAVAASYTWIFVEAVYLHMLIFVSVFTEKMRIVWFILLGWLFPGIIILCLCIARSFLDNTFCWNTFEIHGLRWIFKGPIMLTILINFLLFINTIRVLYTKLKAPQCVDSKKTKYRKLARGTFFLVPTFGVYFIVFTIPLEDLGGTAEFVMLSIEMFFNSFQGFFIALVLCFINLEVRTEMKRSLTRGSGFRWGEARNSSGQASSRNSRHDSYRPESPRHLNCQSDPKLSESDNEHEMCMLTTDIENVVKEDEDNDRNDSPINTHWY